MEYEPSWRLNISDICRDFYNLSKKYQQKSLSYDSSMFNFEFNESGCFDEPIIIDDDDDSPSNQNQNIITITILSVDDAIREHKSKNGNKRLAWESFKHHSSTSLEAKYWLGYYYFHDKEIPELLQIDKRIRIKTAALMRGVTPQSIKRWPKFLMANTSKVKGESDVLLQDSHFANSIYLLQVPPIKGVC
ncbi:12465_t:CDS:2 [Rhizophagus irregularis]|nr:12465_t:CDS:2 [Rhizophagus irregularis]